MQKYREENEDRKYPIQTLRALFKGIFVINKQTRHSVIKDSAIVQCTDTIYIALTVVFEVKKTELTNTYLSNFSPLPTLM